MKPDINFPNVEKAPSSSAKIPLLTPFSIPFLSTGTTLLQGKQFRLENDFIFNKPEVIF